MKKIILLAITFISLSVTSQTDSLMQFRMDSIRNKHIQDSIRDKELLDILGPMEPKNEVTPPQVTPEVIVPKTESPATPTIVPTESVSTKPVDQEPIKQNSTPPDSLKSKLSSDSLIKKQKLDSIKPVSNPPDNFKQSTTLDTLKAKPLPPDTLKPKEAIAEVISKPLLPDSIIRKMPLDSLTPEQLMQYYLSEPEPIQFYKGPDVGDSVYYVLNPLTIPTQTVEGEALLRHGDGLDNDQNQPLDSSSSAEQRLKPKISLGVGRMGFNGDLYSKHFQKPSVGRPAFDLAISHRVTRYLQLDFNVLFGKLGANERLNGRNENFQSEIRAGGVNLIYDFGNFIPDLYKVRPFVSFGAYGFEFLSKTDLKDKNGNTYYYWSDGSIKDKAEGSPEAQNAKDLVRDYSFESDIRELNKDGFGKYQERAWAFPIGAGVVMKVTDRVDLKLNFQYYFSTTDYIDGISNKSVGERAGTRKRDNFTYSSVGIQYDLISKYKKSNRFKDTLSAADWFAFDTSDSDNDGVIDLQDDCQGTAPGAKVNEKGCPVDEDNDGIPTYRDDELTTAAGNPVNARGVGQTDEYWKVWYDQYLNDSLATDRTTQYTGNIYAAVEKKPKNKKESFTVELVRYAGPIPTDELAFLLSIGDINSTTLDDGTTVVYTSGDNLGAAIKRRDEFVTKGTKGIGVSRMEGKEMVQVPATELEKLLQSEIDDLQNIRVGDSISVANSPSDSVSSPNQNVLAEEAGVFSKEDIVYRVQLGAFRNKISTKVFNTSAGVLELKTGENIYRYVTKGYKTIEDAAGIRADLVVQGYSDAFVTAYKGGKRIPMNQTKATMDKSYKEDLREDKIFNSIDKKLLTFKVQLGPLKKANQESSMDEKVRDILSIEKQTTATGNIRYTAGGEFSRLDVAEKYRKELEDKGYTDAFIIATFKNEIISIQEAMELLK